MSPRPVAPKGTPTATEALLARAQYFSDQAFSLHRDLPTSKSQLRSHLNRIWDEYKVLGAPLGIHGPDEIGFAWYFQELGATPEQADKLAGAILKIIADGQRA